MGVICNFNAGELSPLLFCRPELEKYASGASRMENFEVLPQGGMRNRPGTEFVGNCFSDDSFSRLIPFKFNVEQVFMLEFADFRVRVWDPVSLTPLASIVSPYPHTKLRALKSMQIGDVVFLVHKEYPPHKLVRYGSNDWRLDPIVFSGGPFLDENAEDISVTPSGTTGEITLTATEPIFKVPAGGMLFRVRHPNRNSQLNHTFEDSATDLTVEWKPQSEAMKVYGSWKLKTSGGWFGKLSLKRSFDNGTTWIDYRTWISNQDVNVESNGEEARENVLYKLFMEDWKESTAGTSYRCNANLQVEEYWIDGIVKLNPTEGLVSSVTGTVIEAPGSTDATQDWSFGAWSADYGYPSVIALYQDRLCFAGSEHDPQTVWMSKTGDYYNFEDGTNADDPITVTLKTNELNEIRWILPRDEIMIGTAGAEGLLQAVDKNEPISPDNREYREKTAYGAADLPAILAQDCVLFLQRGGEHFREFTYDYSKEGYLAPDISILAEHILKGGALEVAFKALPFPALYFVRADGQLVGFTYERVQNVTAWYRWITDGSVESVAVLPTDSGDQLWITAKRGNKRFIERFFERNCAAPSESVFLDSARRSAEGLEHLEGRVVTAVADGKEIPNLTVSNGSVSVPDHTSVLVGLPYVSHWESMPIELVGQGGSTVGKEKKTHEIRLIFRDSLGGCAGFRSSGVLERLDFRNAAHPADAVPPLQTGMRVLHPASAYTSDERVIVEQSAPMPLCIPAVVYEGKA